MTSSSQPSKIPVLAVDDVPANLIALEAVLSPEYQVISAGSGPEAITLLEKGLEVDVILMDIQMPKMDGFEAARRIKLLPGCDDIPIIFITAIYREEPFIKRGYEAGGVDYFSKPFDPAILKMKVTIYSSFRQKIALLRDRERQIRESEELLQAGRKLSAVLEGLPVGVLIADVEGRICQMNEEVSRILKTAEPMESDTYGEILGWWDKHGHTMKNENGPLFRAIHDGESSHNEVMQIECLDGTAKTLVASASPLRALDGHVVGAVVVIQDVTESKKIAVDLKNRITRLISAGVELEQSIAH